jgi:radical SAM protein with 4Fe4S-binding SPASM domain
MPHANKRMISFFLTTQCNLRCIYCYNAREREKESCTISLDFAKAGIDHFFNTSDCRHIRFYGPGEPTQAFAVMQDIYNYAYLKAGEKVTAEIQTNGVFNNKVRRWLGEKVGIIWLSFDGTCDIQDFNRPTRAGKPSSPIIEENARWLCENSDAMVGARVTMTNKNIHRQNEMIDYFFSLGIKRVWTNPLFPSVEDIAVCNDKKRKDDYDFDMDAYVDEYISAYTYAQKKDFFWGSFLTCNFDGKSPYNCRACLPMPHLTPDGYISACDMVTSGKRAHHMRPFIIGEWDEAHGRIVWNNDRIETLRSRAVANMPGCKGCIASKNCAGYCLGEVLNETGSLFGKKPHVCKAIHKLYRSIGVAEEQYDYLHP